MLSYILFHKQEIEEEAPSSPAKGIATKNLPPPCLMHYNTVSISKFCNQVVKVLICALCASADHQCYDICGASQSDMELVEDMEALRETLGCADMQVVSSIQATFTCIINEAVLADSFSKVLYTLQIHK